MQNQMIMMLMNQLKAKNPQAFQMMEKAIQNKNDPMEIYKQITSKNSPEQMNMFYKKVEQMGFPSEIINKLKG